MSNKSKSIKKKINNVSIITINQLKRKECLLNLYELIKLQTYKNIIEWVIVEGSHNESDANENKNHIMKLKETSQININYIEYTGKKLSDLRNLGNNACQGDIIVCMDDDDYYPPERVESAVTTLDKSSCLIAGCSDIYLYDYFLDKLYKFKGFHDKHTTNNCMAFKKEYLKDHRHDSGLEMSEEKSFTNNFTVPLVQLNSKKCIIVSSHDYNTFNKRELCIGGSYGINKTLDEVNDHPITSYIPKDIFNKMKSIFYKPEDSPYDIVYYTGSFNTKWDPKDKSLGGSEQAIVKLSEEWVKTGLKVAVYTNLVNDKEQNYNGVEYKKWNTLPLNHNFNKIILWRNYGFFCGIPFNLNAKNIYWDIHDNFIQDDLFSICHKKNINKITKIMFKSNYHKSAYEDFYKVKLNNNNYVIIPNGLQIEKFSNNRDNVSRNPYRMCYVSYYTRGLIPIVLYIFNVIKQIEPRAELHLYYGMDMFKDQNIIDQLKNVIKMPGVIDHGRQSIDLVAREKYQSNFQLYITNTIAEIDCISIRESLICGCIPIISNFGVFAEREGIHFNLDDRNPEAMKDIAISIVKLMQDKDKMNVLRNVFKKSKTIMGWDTIANEIKLI